MSETPARIRSCPEDFVVEEVALYPPKGEGGHTFVWVEKCRTTTPQVARALADAAGVATRDVGFAGRKEKWAVTRQWFSVPGLDPEKARALDLPEARVLFAAAHPHKLRTAQLAGNRFALRVRDVEPAKVEAARAKLAEMVARGMPNRFGTQRFGRDGDNAAEAKALLSGQRRVRDKKHARFLLSALQSEVFNRVLEERPLALDELEPGDVARVERSGGLFVVEDAAAETARARGFEISPTGPIFGAKCMAASGEPGAREARVLEAFGVADPAAIVLPRGLRLPGTRRPLRVRPQDAQIGCEEDGVWLRCQLPAGSYVTVLVEELFGDYAEGPAE